MIPREILKKIRQIELRTSRIVWAAMSGLLLLCSCTTAKQQSSDGVVVASEFPPEVIMNHDAGRGNWLFVSLRLESGEELPVLFDTGAAATYLDKSLAPKLGAPLNSGITPNDGRHRSPRYHAPKLFLDDVQLKTGNTVELLDFAKESSQARRRVMGVLGISCLKHYCIQLDFDAGKIRFLDPNHLETASLGQAFPVNFSEQWHQPLLQTGGLVDGTAKPTLIDSGYNADGTLNGEHFAAAIRGGTLIPINSTPGWATLPKCLWNGETHTNLIIAKADWNAIGLRFLARHLVTLNFPKRTMYLKQTRNTPLPRQ